MYIIDSNILIYSSQPQFDYLRKLIAVEAVFCSKISKLEVLGFRRITAIENTYFKNLFNEISLIGISDAIIERSILIKQSKKTSLGDAIIAATALEYDLVLMTNNADDFKNIKGIKLNNPIK